MRACSAFVTGNITVTYRMPAMFALRKGLFVTAAFAVRARVPGWTLRVTHDYVRRAGHVPGLHLRQPHQVFIARLPKGRRRRACCQEERLSRSLSVSGITLHPCVCTHIPRATQGLVTKF